MRPPDLDATWVVLGEADPDVMDRDELVALQRQVASVKAWCDAVQVRATRRLRALAAEGRSEAPKDVLANEGRQSTKDARAADERERVASTLPGFEEALSTGDVSSGHLDAVANATRTLDANARAEFAAHADDLLADAKGQTVDRFERSCRDLAREITAVQPGATPEDEQAAREARANVKHWLDRETGMWHTHLELDPVRDATLWAAIRAARQRILHRLGTAKRNWQQIEVDAVIEAIGGGGERVPEVIVLVDDHTRCHGRHDRTVCETTGGQPMPVSTVQRMCCDAEIAIVHLDGRREVINLGRSERTATRAQRRALRAMHRTCAHPSCAVSFDDCRIHHIRFFRFGGPTDIENLLPLCEEHHHLVHEGGWQLTVAASRIATWVRPDGTHHHTGPTIDRLPTSSRRSRPPIPA